MSLLSKLVGRSCLQLPELDRSHPLVIELSAELRKLDALPVSTKEERKIWREAAHAFERRLRTDWSSIYDSLPHELEHYLVDDDIRAKDEVYVRYQRKLLAPLLTPDEPIQPPQPTTGSSAPDRA